MITLQDLTISNIARLIQEDWANISPHAMPYLRAMLTMESIKDNYYADSGSSVVAYFLSNANSWRGEVARNVKAELKRRLKTVGF